MTGVDDGDRGGWWGESRLAEGETRGWRIGSLELAVCRGVSEWQIAYEWDAALADAQDWEARQPDSLPEEPTHHERFVVGRTGPELRLRPALADRPVVSMPRVPFHLLPQNDVTLFVGSPVWVRLEVGEAAVLREMPSQRPSDTWFGDSTREGELCYATETRALLHLENLPILRRSAVTPVRIRNLAPSPLFLERLKLPVPLLELFCDRQGRLWTQGVTLTRSEESDMASLDIRSGPPQEATDTTPLAPARETPETRLWIRAFSSLLKLTRGEEEPT